MKTAKCIVEELFWDGSARISCPPELIPAPGQYLLAHANASSDLLPVPLFSSRSTPNGFRSAPPLPRIWRPGDSLTVRGPIGHGFALPLAARKIALIAFDDSPARLLGLIPLALKQGAEIVLVSDSSIEDLPEIIEVQPLKAMHEILQWADYAALDAARENLNQLQGMVGEKNQAGLQCEAQVLVRTPVPCGGLAECGVCAVTIRHEWKMACKDGPVFSLKELL
jgi:dihydroorotate dehydrogenase electron transfer subunit